MRPIHFIGVVLLMGGCSPAPTPKREEPSAENTRQTEQLRTEEFRQREQAEARSREQEARIMRWQLFAILAMSANGVTLVVGVILGSRARHEASA